MTAKLIIGPGQNGADATIFIEATEGADRVPAMDVVFQPVGQGEAMPLLEGMVEAANGALAFIDAQSSGGGGPR